MDLDGSDKSNQGSTEPGEPEENNNEEGRGEVYTYQIGEVRTKAQRNVAEQASASGDTEQEDKKHKVNKEVDETVIRRIKTAQANLKVTFSYPRLRQDDDCTLYGQSRFWH